MLQDAAQSPAPVCKQCLGHRRHGEERSRVLPTAAQQYPLPGAQLQQIQPWKKMQFPSNEQWHAEAAYQESKRTPRGWESLNAMRFCYDRFSTAFWVSRGQGGLGDALAPDTAPSSLFGFSWGKRGVADEGLAPPGIAAELPVIFGKHAPSGRGAPACQHYGTETRDDPSARAALHCSACSVPGSWDPATRRWLGRWHLLQLAHPQHACTHTRNFIQDLSSFCPTPAFSLPPCCDIWDESLNLGQMWKALESCPPPPQPGRSIARARDARTVHTLLSLAWGDTSSATGLLPRAPSCSARFSGPFIAFAVPGQPEASAAASAVTAGLIRAGCHGEAAAHAGKPPRLGHPGRAGAERSRGHRGAQGQPVAQARESLPGWHRASSLTCPAPKWPTTGHSPRGLGNRVRWQGPWTQPSVSGRDADLHPCPAWERSRFAPAQVPLPLQHCSHVSPPKSLSESRGQRLFTPSSCDSSLAGHPSQQLLPRTGSSDAALKGGQRAAGRFGEQGGVSAASVGSHAKSSSPTSDKAGNVSTGHTGGAERCAAVGQDEHALATKSWALAGKAVGRAAWDGLATLLADARYGCTS